MLRPKRLKSIFPSVTSKHLELAQNIRPLDIYPQYRLWHSPSPIKGKKGIKKEDSLMCVDLMSYVYRPVDGYV